METDSSHSKSPLDIESANPADRTIPGGRKYLTCLRISLVLLVVAVLCLYRIDRPLLWCDEAETGVVARNVLRYGYPIATDGRNVNMFDGGAQLNKNLIYKRIPWVQYYLGALSLVIFGDNTAGLRIIFVITGLLAFFPIHAVLKSRVKCPDIIAGLVLISPQIVLFQRNARYYSIFIFLYSLLVWHLSTDFKNAKIRLIIASLVLVLFFHSHPLAAGCCCISLILFCLFFRREALLVYIFSSGIAFLSWLLWYELLGPPLRETNLAISLFTSDFISWLEMFFVGIIAVVVDLDAVDCFPILLWMGIIALLLLRGRKTVPGMLREPLISFVFLNVIIQTIVTAALFGYETVYVHSILRYMPHLLVFIMVACFFMLNSVIPVRKLFLPVCIFVVAFNFMTLSYWVKPYSRNVPASWLWPVYSEIFRPQNNIWDDIIAKIRGDYRDSPHHDKTLIIDPPWTIDVAIFYLGDLYLVPPSFNSMSIKYKQSIRKVLGEQSYNKLNGRPEWILDILGVLQTVPDGYVTAAVVPSYQTTPDQGARPELTRHAFPRSGVVQSAKLFRLQE